MERVAHLRDVSRQHREHDTGRDDGDEPGADAPVLGVAPIATGELGRARADQDQHGQAIHDLLIERGEHKTHRFGEPADVGRVLEDAEHERGAGDEQEFAPGRKVGAVESEPAPPDHDHEEELDRQSR